MRALGRDTLFPSIPPRNTSACVNRGQLTGPRQLLARWSYFTGHIWTARTPALGWPRRIWRVGGGGSKTRITLMIRNLAAGKAAKEHRQLSPRAPSEKRFVDPRWHGDLCPFLLSLSVWCQLQQNQLLEVKIQCYRFIQPQCRTKLLFIQYELGTIIETGGKSLDLVWRRWSRRCEKILE